MRMKFWQRNSTEEILKKFEVQCAAEVHSILGFWSKYMLDSSTGGFFGHMSNDFRVHQKHDRHIVMQLRCLLAFSLAGKMFDNTRYVNVAQGAFDYVNRTFWDNSKSGYYWQSNVQGELLDRTKFVYAQSLGIYALSTFDAVCCNDIAINMAMELFDKLELCCKSSDGRTYLTTLDSNWQERPKQRMRVGDNDGAVSVGVQLHVYEAYVALYRRVKSDKVLGAIRKLARMFNQEFQNPSSGLLYLYLDNNFNSKTEEMRPGHDAEFVSLSISSSRFFNEELRTKLLSRAIDTIDTVRSMTDNRSSTLYYIENVSGRPVKFQRWWDQAEMMLALWHSYESTGDEKYLLECWKCWTFVRRKMRINEYGEWRWNVRTPRRGYSGHIAGDWKTPYHSVRVMCALSKGAANILAYQDSNTSML